MAGNAKLDAVWEGLPPPENKNVPLIKKEEILRRLETGEMGRSLLVDVRRGDWEGGSIQDSFNLPANSCYYVASKLVEIAKKAGVAEVVFYCGSSTGRGPRAAGWFEDQVKETETKGVKALVLEGGIKGWEKGGSRYVRWLEGYDEKVWKQQS